MISLRKSKASRLNGARSRGPATPAGKSRSSANAIRHGLLAKCVVLGNESQDNFQTLLEQYLHKLAPRDGVEFGMVEDMVASYWRLRRAFAIEKHLFDQTLDAHPEGEDLFRLGQAWGELADSPGLLHLHRYQTTLHRMHQRALYNFLLLREIEPDDAELRKEPSPISGHSATLPVPEPLVPSTALPSLEPLPSHIPDIDC